MKKVLVLFILCGFFSCKTSKKTNKPQVKTSLTDSWLLKKISFEEANIYDKVILFNDVTNLCFKDSRWQFNSKDAIGTYTINDLYCSYGKREIAFRFLKKDEKTGVSDFVFEVKNKTGNTKFYRIKVRELSNKTMQWDYVVYIKNKRHIINMHFERIPASS